MTPENLLYNKEHEWVNAEDNNAVIGITDYAQDALGDIVYVDLPQVGQQVKAGEAIGEIESVKSTAELHTPVSGKVVEINQQAIDSPEIVNEKPYDNGWLFKVELSNHSELDDLMKAQAYEKYTKEL